MKNSKIALMIVVLSSLMLGACAKKDSEFAAKYKNNKMGAEVVDGAKTQEAAEQAAAKGVEADIVAIQKTADGNTQVVTSIILVNNSQVPVTTRHSGLGIAEGTLMVGAHQVVFRAVCGNFSCNPYYASLEIYQNGQMVIQEGVRKYFDGIVGLDRYQWLQPNEALPLIGGTSFSANDLEKGSVLVGFLNGKSNSSSGIVK